MSSYRRRPGRRSDLTAVAGAVCEPQHTGSVVFEKALA